ncbi:hypothetical protein B5K06_31280 [Rhizobium grahamii]|uniref:Uncharacterized protein n=1 Tax=Rhizobium grahamii TaxID=1120045 RepID=A0A370KF83_9HYPH|nr:hypothetical protein B5K06_31280 [Rhizobium grahamii]
MFTQKSSGSCALLVESSRLSEANLPEDPFRAMDGTCRGSHPKNSGLPARGAVRILQMTKRTALGRQIRQEFQFRAMQEAC